MLRASRRTTDETTTHRFCIDTHAWPSGYGQGCDQRIAGGHKRDHPFGTHMYPHECKLLAKCLNQNPGVKATVSNG